MNTKIFTINQAQLKKAGIKFILVLLGAVATYLETYFIQFSQEAISNPLVLGVVLAINTALIDIIRKFISDEEGKFAGIKIN